MDKNANQPANSFFAPPVVDLAEHFLECGKVGRYLTLVDESRFIVTDDFGQSVNLPSIATATASVFSRDTLVARAALNDNRTRERYEELFTLIEKTAFSAEVRSNAEGVLRSGFDEVRIRDLERELGGMTSPARQRYRIFLGIVRDLMERKISVEGFREEFLEFTRAVAGKLDFGIFSFCLDRIFMNQQIPMNAKGALVAEVMLFPTLIRRELLTNILSGPGQEPEFIQFVRNLIEQELPNESVVEIYLLVTLKSSRMSLGDVEDLFLNDKSSTLDSLSSVPGLHGTA
ncbi:MAG: hypothetical protein HN644_04560 [Rhodospirillales bacterium]|nr:hypothetical protein [Rhodospirillales bacterium]MBT4039485.1 hypothetical protein [Rhodospirillales bacterium]MBT4627122.1 hypothetical protein [Rhodospirillales bacterium]MBT5351138.1 hypothetical protein [Rhodospirillales bacterium]MBT5520467.1 hypothetical protein [Rhodospirillales bacterium]